MKILNFLLASIVTAQDHSLNDFNSNIKDVIVPIENGASSTSLSPEQLEDRNYVIFETINALSGGLKAAALQLAYISNSLSQSQNQLNNLPAQYNRPWGFVDSYDGNPRPTTSGDRPPFRGRDNEQQLGETGPYRRLEESNNVKFVDGFNSPRPSIDEEDDPFDIDMMDFPDEEEAELLPHEDDFAGWFAASDSSPNMDSFDSSLFDDKSDVKLIGIQTNGGQVRRLQAPYGPGAPPPQAGVRTGPNGRGWEASRIPSNGGFDGNFGIARGGGITRAPMTNNNYNNFNNNNFNNNNRAGNRNNYYGFGGGQAANQGLQLGNGRSYSYVSGNNGGGYF